MKTYQEIVNDVVEELIKNQEWKKRYKDYYYAICSESENNLYVEAVMRSFKCNGALTKYLSVGRVKNINKHVDIDLRVNGHSIGSYCTELTEEVKNAIKENADNRKDIIQKDSSLMFKKKGLKKVASSDDSLKDLFYEAAERFGDSKVAYLSKEAKCFRKMILENDTISTDSEHSIESRLLKLLDSNISKNKPITYIKPIKLCNAFFQLVTPLKASSVEKKDVVSYSKNGGGIDILARIKNEKNQSELCVIELKDNYSEEESPTKAIKQAIAYSTFVDALVRNEDAKGNLWYKNVFGMGESLTKPIKINAVIAMPYKDESYSVIDSDIALAGQKVYLKWNDGIEDVIELHYLFFDKKDIYNNDMQVDCSLKTFRNKG